MIELVSFDFENLSESEFLSKYFDRFTNYLDNEVLFSSVLSSFSKNCKNFLDKNYSYFYSIRDVLKNKYGIVLIAVEDFNCYHFLPTSNQLKYIDKFGQCYAMSINDYNGFTKMIDFYYQALKNEIEREIAEVLNLSEFTINYFIKPDYLSVELSKNSDIFEIGIPYNIFESRTFMSFGIQSCVKTMKLKN
jgi:hypothetical protein